jgi:hypothetical protein
MKPTVIGKVAAMPKQYDQQTKAKAVRLVQDHVGDYACENEANRAVLPAGNERGGAAKVDRSGRG